RFMYRKVSRLGGVPRSTGLAGSAMSKSESPPNTGATHRTESRSASPGAPYAGREPTATGRVGFATFTTRTPVWLLPTTTEGLRITRFQWAAATLGNWRSATEPARRGDVGVKRWKT